MTGSPRRLFLIKNIGNVNIDPRDLHPRDRDPPLYYLYNLVHQTYAYMPKELATDYGSIASVVVG